jgi:hypothetical protein
LLRLYTFSNAKVFKNGNILLGKNF